MAVLPLSSVIIWILISEKMQLQVNVSVNSLWGKKTSYPSLLNATGKVCRCAGDLIRRQVKKRGEEGARSSRHGWQQSIACDKCFRGLQDQNKHVHAQTTTTSQSAEVQVTGTKNAQLLERGLKLAAFTMILFHNTTRVRIEFSLNYRARTSNE